MSFLEAQVRRNIWFRIATAAVLIGGVATALIVTSRYYLNYVTGPLAVDAPTMARATAVGDLPRYFVTVQGDDVLPTEWQHVTIEKSHGQEVSREIDSAYVLLAVGDKRLLVRSKHGAAREQTGALNKLTEASNEDRQVYGKLRKEDPEAAQQLLPMVLDASDSFRTSGTIGLVVMAVALAIAALHIVRALRARDRGHPVYARLARLGAADELATKIDADIEKPDTARFGRGTWVSPSWLVHCSTYDVHAILHARLVWAYKFTRKTKRAFVTVAKDHEAKIFDRDGNKLEIKMKEKQVDALLAAVEQRAPWAIVGWNADLERMMKREKAALIAMVDERQRASSASDQTESVGSLSAK